ncbi:MAG: 5-oxoprolinase [Pseudomonadota bacterium]|nr:5-oxoprolinase [Pseudomonadota bacterium]QKK06093.1 MAG: 5-oxoprolinase [Pseudomonadota bacterium]
MASDNTQKKWQFWIDRGGTFTDIVARDPDGNFVTHKLLSENPEHYKDAAVAGIRALTGLAETDDVPPALVEHVKMGTTVGTNALLEHKGAKTVLVTTKGFKDQLRIGYQARPDIFARHIILPEMLYGDVIEAAERFGADGAEILPLDESALQKDLQTAFNQGYRSCAIVFMHGYRYTAHEEQAAKIAQEIGFTQISASHTVAPLIKMVSRGDTTVVDAYLSPVLRHYVDQVAGALPSIPLMFMRSSGGLTDAHLFAGKDCIVSGPAGGIVGAAETAKAAGFDRIIGFDMGGTSTDVAHYAGEYERRFDTVIAGARIRAPMMDIHTVAAGGGSICFFDGMRMRVGPDSAGANPGPAGYRKGGPLTVTDCNIMLGKLRPEFFPHIFGPDANRPLDKDTVAQKFAELSAQVFEATGERRTQEELAEGFLTVAVLSMADAIKKISVRRGYNVTEYTLACFGGAGGQHACLVADMLGMKKIYLHPFAGVLSAYGMGLAATTAMREKSVEQKLDKNTLPAIAEILDALITETTAEMTHQNFAAADLTHHRRLHIRYDGTDKAQTVPFGTYDEIIKAFEAQYLQHYGFLMPEAALVIEAGAVESIARAYQQQGDAEFFPAEKTDKPLNTVQVYMAGARRDTPVYSRDTLPADHVIDGPAIIREATGTTVVEPDWQAAQDKSGNLVLTRKAAAAAAQEKIATDKADPVILEVFNNLFMSIAEQMGAVLENTAYSVNIKERLDFSCAVFDKEGGLIANAPHMPVHLGSMGESVRTIINNRTGQMKPGDAYMLNDPYHGGTHLPDITIITPVFGTEDTTAPLFYVASRGHHADIGGITPGSMPAYSTHIDEEGILLNDVEIVHEGRFREAEIRDILSSGKYPARNIDQNIKDLRAQIAANARGAQELLRMVETYSLDVVNAYMQHIQDNAEEHVRRAITVLKDGSFIQKMDNGAEIHVNITINQETRSAKVDFTGTSAQLTDSNFNAPLSVCRAAVLYVFRTLVDDAIPMNEGCLKPVELIVPDASMLNPQPPAAVVAGNVETSQCVTNALYGALGVMAAAQGTMNNFTFGNKKYQYYETIAGGSGAGPDFDGTSAVQTHMTNSRLTDPEILEFRYPVRLEEFSIRQNSGGGGKHKGGNGVIRRLRFLENMTASLLANHHEIPPFGVNGGGEGQTGICRVEHSDGTIEMLSATGQAKLEAGDIIHIETPGGGGYGKN